MGNRGSINNLITTDRKTLYIILTIVIASVLTLTVVYAALSTTLNINGQTDILASNWNIHLDNIVLNEKSATSNAPTITSPTTATFSTELLKPGDFYEFTIDVVNDGTIDAMIDSVTKTPELTSTQKKYLNYIVEYQNGEPITVKQKVEKNSSVRLKIKVEFRNDISASDLPTHEEELNLSFMVNYIQSDETSVNVSNNGIANEYQIGDEICYGTECFYVISSTNNTITMLSKYNLYFGNKCTDWSTCTAYGDEATGLQDPKMTGAKYDAENNVNFPFEGTTAFSSTNYWIDTDANEFNAKYSPDYTVNWEEITQTAYVYDSNSYLYTPVENYRIYLESQGVSIKEARLITVNELVKLGCNVEEYTCAGAPEWVYSTSYWAGGATYDGYALRVFSDTDTGGALYHHEYCYGVRPVITVEL